MAKTVGDWGKPAAGRTEDPRAIIEARMQPGERLIWHGRGRGLNVTAGNIYALVFLTGWSAFWIFALTSSLSNPSQNVWIVAYAAVLGVVVVSIIGWLAVRNLLAPAHETYGLTDHRIIIYRNLFPRYTSRYEAKDLDFILPSRNQVRFCRYKRGAFHAIAFIGIDRPGDIAELIRTTLRPDLKLGQDPDLQVPPLEPRRPPP